MAVKSIPNPLRDLLSKLEFLGMIKQKQKVCMNDMSFVGANSWQGSIKRNRGGESRTNLVLCITQIIEETIDAIKQYTNTEFLHLIYNSLNKARTGINNLIDTYSDDPNFIGKIRVCIMNIDLQLKSQLDKRLNPGQIA